MMNTMDALHKMELQVRRLYALVERAVEEGWRTDEVEREVFAGLMEAGHVALTSFVSQQGDGDEGATLEHEGRTLKRLAGKRTRRYVSIFGPLQIKRFVYGTREKQKIERVPLDARLGLPAGEVSYVLEDWQERMCLKEAFREATDSLAELLGVRISVDTAEEHCRRMAEQATSFRMAQASRKPPPSKEEGPIMVVTADGKGVPMIRPPSEPPAEQQRRTKGQKAHKKQMSYVGAAYTIEPYRRTVDDVLDEVLRKQRSVDRPVPKNKHLWVEMTRPGDDKIQAGMLLHGPSYLFAELAVEVHYRDPTHKKPLICLLDGEKQLWDQQASWLSRAIGVLDLFHAAERLWTVAHCLHREGSAAAQKFVTKQLRRLLCGRVKGVIKTFERLLKDHALSAEKRGRIRKALVYYRNNQQHMKYDEYLAAGYPIGSGVAEGACRHLVKDRLEQTGMRWTLAGAQSLLHLRALYLNGVWKAFIQHRIDAEQAQLYGQAA